MKSSRMLSLTAIWLTLTIGHAQAQGGTWTTKAPMPTVRFGLATSVVNGVVYAVGGCNFIVIGGPCNDLGTVEAYDPVSNTWTTKAPMPTARRGLGTSVVNGLIYAIGGFTGGPLATVEAYDPVSNTWTSKASMPTGRCCFGIGEVNGTIYAAGGNNGSILGTNEAYDPASDTWTTKAPMPTPTLYTSASGVNGVLYVVGGGTDSGFLMPVEAYDPASDTWTTKASILTPRYGLATSVVNGVIYAVGGYAGGSRTTTTVETYDPASDSWTTKAPMPTPRTFPSASGVGNVLYTLGGYDETSVPLSTNEAFTPVYAAQVQQPINPDGSSVFSVKRGVVPVKFTLTSGGVATCQLPPATISLNRTAGAVLGSIDESTYLLASDNGSNFRIDAANCQYVYNLATSSLGTGTYVVSISIGGSAAASGTFGLK